MIPELRGESSPDGRDFRLEFLPVGLEDALAAEAPAWSVEHRQRRRILAAVRAFISRLITAARANDLEEWVPVRQEEAIAAFGFHNWHRVRDWLIKADWIECDGRWRVLDKALCYRRGPRWRGVQIRRQRSHDAQFIRLYDAIRGRETADPTPMSPVERYLRRWLQVFMFDQTDIDRGMQTIDGENPRPRRRKRRKPAPKGVKVIRLKRTRRRKRTSAEIEKARREYANTLYALATEGGEVERGFIRCKFRRFHSVVTRMPTWMRQAIRIHGRPLVEIDIAACQPFIQAILARRWWISRETTAADPTAATGTGSETEQSRQGMYCSFALPKSLPTDLAEFFRRYRAGEDFYLSFARALALPSTGDAKRDRAAAKDAWMKLAYDCEYPNDAKWKRLWAAYRKAYPTIAAWLSALKMEHGYASAAQACQLFESRVMIDGVVAHLAEHYPDMAVLTVHDAVLCHEENVPIVLTTSPPSGSGSPASSPWPRRRTQHDDQPEETDRIHGGESLPMLRSQPNRDDSPQAPGVELRPGRLRGRHPRRVEDVVPRTPEETRWPHLGQKPGYRNGTSVRRPGAVEVPTLRPLPQRRGPVRRGRSGVRRPRTTPALPARGARATNDGRTNHRTGTSGPPGSAADGRRGAGSMPRDRARADGSAKDARGWRPDRVRSPPGRI